MSNALTIKPINMKKKLATLLFLFITHFSISQSQSYTYSSSGEYEFDKSLNSFKFLENSYEESKTIIDIDEKQKEIFITRIFKSSNAGLERTGEKYYYVKKELKDSGFKYYAIDLVNKKYVELIISLEQTSIAENCNGFTGCNKITTFLK